MTVPEAHVGCPQDRSYDIQGTATHSHAVDLIVEDYTDLEMGNELVLSILSADGTHAHVIYAECQ